MSFPETRELQWIEVEEVDLQKHILTCKKNPGHSSFIPVQGFTSDHLPAGYTDPTLVSLIKATADLTVRVVVTAASPLRPQCWDVNENTHLEYDIQENDKSLIGTGIITRVKINSLRDFERYAMEYCKRKRCQESDNPSKVWGTVRVETASHVVFDSNEARHASCRIFFDAECSPLVSLNGWTLMKSDAEKDRCKLKCYTCEVELLERLRKIFKERWRLRKIVNQKYKVYRESNKLCYIVSHPHGCSKQISIGEWVEKSVIPKCSKGTVDTKYTYRTCTCPGSSGAHVHFLGFDSVMYGLHIHCGVTVEGVNFSGIGQERL